MSLVERVCKVLEGVEGEAVAEDTNLESLRMDSFDRVELLMDLEDEFMIEISDDVAEEWVTVKDIVKTVEDLYK